MFEEDIDAILERAEVVDSRCVEKHAGLGVAQKPWTAGLGFCAEVINSRRGSAADGPTAAWTVLKGHAVRTLRPTYGPWGPQGNPAWHACSEL